MPGGRVHDFLTVIGAAVAVPVYDVVTQAHFHDYATLGTLAGATLFSGLFLSPDLDLNCRSYHRWGPLRFVWWPYQKLIHHRSPLSHSCVVGPALRIAYFLFFFWSLFRIVTFAIAAYIHPFDRNALSGLIGNDVLHFAQAHPDLLLAAAIGMVWGATIHVCADLTVTRVKRWARH